MALALRTLPRMIRATTARYTRPRPAARTMVVRAFKEDEKQQETKAVEKQSEQASKDVARPTTDVPVLPFKRLNQAMLDMQREMDYMMQHFGMMDPFMRSSPFAMMEPLLADVAPFRGAVPAVSRVAPLEVQEDDKAYTVTAEIPGFSKNDIKVTVDPATSIVTITGQKETKTEDGDKGKTSMRSATSFTRTFTLPMDVEPEAGLAARVEHGVLVLTLPKAQEEVKQRNIKDIPVN